jgi:hypothetical protein
MGCNFDTVVCRYPLPGDVPTFLKKCPVFQTNDLGGGMGDFEITVDGHVKRTIDKDVSAYLRSIGVELEAPLKWKRKKIEISGSNLRCGRPSPGGYQYFTDDGSDYCQIVYVVQIRDSVVSSITERVRKTKPASKREPFKL